MSKETITYFIITLVTLIPTGLLLAFIPYLTRKTENFGVTIPASMYGRDDFNQMRKKYAAQMIGLLIITVLLILFIILYLTETMAGISLPIIVLLYLVGGFILYIPFHFKMKHIKQAENWHASRKETYFVNMKFRNEKLTISNIWFSLYLFFIFITAIIPIILFDSIPGQIPIHTDFTGNITYQEKSIRIMLMMPAMQLVMLVMFLAINLMIKYSKQQVDVDNPERSIKQNTIYRRRWSIYGFNIGLLTIFLLAYIQFGFIYPSLSTYNILISSSYTAVILIVTIILALNTGQGGSRIKINDDSDDTVIPRDDDVYWKLGQFYVNRNDPAIFVEKRFGIGWTNNWAHPLSWIMLVGLIGVVFIPLIFI